MKKNSTNGCGGWKKTDDLWLVGQVRVPWYKIYIEYTTPSVHFYKAL